VRVREGADVTLVSTGVQTARVYEAAESWRAGHRGHRPCTSRPSNRSTRRASSRPPGPVAFRGGGGPDRPGRAGRAVSEVLSEHYPVFVKGWGTGRLRGERAQRPPAGQVPPVRGDGGGGRRVTVGRCGPSPARGQVGLLAHDLEASPVQRNERKSATTTSGAPSADRGPHRRQRRRRRPGRAYTHGHVLDDDSRRRRTPRRSAALRYPSGSGLPAPRRPLVTRASGHGKPAARKRARARSARPEVTTAQRRRAMRRGGRRRPGWPHGGGVLDLVPVDLRQTARPGAPRAPPWRRCPRSAGRARGCSRAAGSRPSSRAQRLQAAVTLAKESTSTPSQSKSRPRHARNVTRPRDAHVHPTGMSTRQGGPASTSGKK